MAGANLIYGLGMIEMGMTIDYGQLVMDDEFAKMIKFSVQGIPVNDETLAVDAIREIGIAGNFLSHESSFKYMRSQSAPKLIDRNMYEDWEMGGKTTLHDRALEKARDIIENHKPEPISDDIKAQMRAIIEETESELGITK